jgi:hypothetical protein
MAKRKKLVSMSNLPKIYKATRCAKRENADESVGYIYEHGNILRWDPISSEWRLVQTPAIYYFLEMNPQVGDRVRPLWRVQNARRHPTTKEEQAMEFSLQDGDKIVIVKYECGELVEVEHAAGWLSASRKGASLAVGTTTGATVIQVAYDQGRGLEICPVTCTRPPCPPCFPQWGCEPCFKPCDPCRKPDPCHKPCDPCYKPCEPQWGQWGPCGPCPPCPRPCPRPCPDLTGWVIKACPCPELPCGPYPVKDGSATLFRIPHDGLFKLTAVTTGQFGVTSGQASNIDDDEQQSILSQKIVSRRCDSSSECDLTFESKGALAYDFRYRPTPPEVSTEEVVPATVVSTTIQRLCEGQLIGVTLRVARTPATDGNGNTRALAVGLQFVYSSQLLVEEVTSE